MSTPPVQIAKEKASREKTHLESKKFTAWLISEMSWKVILVVALVVWKDDLTHVGAGAWWLLLAIVVTAGFIGTGFILGQAALDKYVRVAEIAADAATRKIRPDGKVETPDTPTDPGASS